MREALRVGFAGTPEFARLALAAIADAGHHIPLVLTQPDRPAGRGLKLQASAVKAEALARGLRVLQPRSLRLDGRFPEDAAAAQAALAQAQLDVLVVAAYGLILPQWALTCATQGALNIHASLLPRWRGAAPIQRAIEAGDRETGITLMQMDAGLDTGPILLAHSLPIGAEDNAARLHDRLAALGAQMVVQVLPQWVSGRLLAVPQPTEGITYAAKVEKAQAAIDWRQPAATIERRVRAFDPAPGASFELGGQTVKLWRAHVDAAPAQDAPPGTCLRPAAQRLLVVCGEGVLELLELQRTGGRRLTAAEFLRGQDVAAGTCLQVAAR